jgi:competence protein ComEC
MVLFTLSFTFGVLLLQQQAALPDFVWTKLLLVAPLLWLFLTLRSPALNRFANFARSFLRFVLIAVFAGGLGFYHAAYQAKQRLSVSLPDDWQGRDIVVVGVVAELPRVHERGLRFGFDVERTLTPAITAPPHVYLSTYFDEKTAPLNLHAGERWQLTLRLKQIHGTSNPHAFDFGIWALENRIRATGYVHQKGDNHLVDARAAGLLYRIETWREAVRDKFNHTLSNAPYIGVLSALAIGDQSSIPASQWQVFTRTGVNHLMSISGLHITMLASVGFALCYFLWRRSVRLTLWLPARRAAALVALLVALAYALLSGYGVPAQRTVYMVAAVAAALWLQRNFSLGQILSFALFGVLIPDPWAVLSAGFWLSFGAVALILYVTAQRVGRSHWLREYATVQWAMTIGLVPLLLALFQQVSLVSPLANAVAIPLVSLIVVPLALLGAALPWDVPLWLAHLVMDYTMQFLVALNRLPQAVWTQHAPPAWSIVSGMLGVLLILAPRGFPARYLGIIFMLPMFFNAPATPAANTARLTIFDVGQGLAASVQTQNHALLFDTGPDFSGEADSGNRILVPVLRAQGINQLDGLILSHNDLDHTGGAASLMQAMPIDWLASSLPDDSPLLENIPMQQGAEMRGLRACVDGDKWQWDGVYFEILHPDKAADNEDEKHRNDLSCVLRVSIASQHILLTGDIEKTSEQRLLKEHAEKLSASLLVVPHHGSKTSSTPEFVAAVLPDYAVFTVGYRNRYGHPKEDVLQRYLDSGASVLRSDKDGAILVEMDARNLSIERYRLTHQRYWTHQVP